MSHSAGGDPADNDATDDDPTDDDPTDDDPTDDERELYQPPGLFDSDTDAEPEPPDPHDLGPPIPEPPDPTETDADIDPGTFRLFWGLVALYNIALLLLSLGVMIAFFEAKYKLGAQLFVAGAILSVYGYYRYRQFAHGDEGDEPVSASTDTEESAGASDEATDSHQKS